MKAMKVHEAAAVAVVAEAVHCSSTPLLVEMSARGRC